MKQDNSTEKDKEFYELGKKIYDRLKPFMPSAPAAGHQCEPQPVQPVNDKLLQIIAATYQIAGVYDAPEHVLDVLANPELATQEQIDALLPFAQPVQLAEPPRKVEVTDAMFDAIYSKVDRILRDAMDIAAAKEREACAKICDVMAVHPEYASDVTKIAALAIRARE